MGSICWKCKNAYGGCSWSENFIEIDGWEAEKTEISYNIKSCPEFEIDTKFSKDKNISVKNLCKLLGISERKYYRVNHEYILALIIEKKLDIYLKNGNWYIKK